MSTPTATEFIEVQLKELEALIKRAQHEPLSAEESGLLLDLARSYVHLTEMLKDKSTTIARLRKLLFGPQSEKLKDVFADDGDPPVAADGEDATDGGEPMEKEQPPKRRKGHGRNGAAAYPGAQRIGVSHATLHTGACCPKCLKGKLHPLAPSRFVRVTGGAPLQATVWELEKLRCGNCGEVFTAASPPGIGEEKYDAAAKSMIALLKYGTGLPFNRLERLQQDLRIPLPASTQWDLVAELAEQVEPVYRQLISEAAQGKVVHNDDTSMTILELTGKRLEKRAADGEQLPERTGVFTSGIVSTADGANIALYFTGVNHAGENLEQLLTQRKRELAPPIQMCDALSRNMSPDFEAIVANCLAHGRRKFVDVAHSFPAECRHVLEALGKVYENDAKAREQQLSPEQRLRFHQSESGSLMNELHQWMAEQFEQRKVEPNSGLGQAIRYMQNHWPKLTLFLRVPGAPLDNNICERALKKAILHRKNALFYKTQNGARVGDLFMSLIQTCHLAGTSAFEYLTELQKHVRDVARDPPRWLPWNYKAALDAAAEASES